jgi:hypothetical protein
MLTGYGDGAPENTYGFHEGIDIWVDGKGGQEVVSMRKGKVLFKNAGYQGGSVTIAVDLGGGVTEWDRYLHVGSLEAGFAIGDTIDAGTKLGVISNSFYSEGSPPRPMRRRRRKLPSGIRFCDSQPTPIATRWAKRRNSWISTATTNRS